MEISEEVKMKVFRVFDRLETLKGFEEWLYQQEELAERMNENFYLELFCFNYNQKDSLNIFKSHFMEYFIMEEFEKWQIKNNLQSLLILDGGFEPLLIRFLDLDWEKWGDFREIGFYAYCFEENDPMGEEYERLTQQMKTQATELLHRLYEMRF